VQTTRLKCDRNFNVWHSWNIWNIWNMDELYIQPLFFTFYTIFISCTIRRPSLTAVLVTQKSTKFTQMLLAQSQIHNSWAINYSCLPAILCSEWLSRLSIPTDTLHVILEMSFSITCATKPEKTDNMQETKNTWMHKIGMHR